MLTFGWWIWLGTMGCGTTEEAVDEAPVEQLVVTATTSSAEARDAFDAARAAADNFRTPEAVAGFEKALELDPDFALAKALLGGLTPGNAGLAMVREASAASESLPEAERTEIASLLAFAEGKQAESTALLEKVATLAPDDWRVQMQLGATAFFNQDYDLARTRLTRATELSPEAGPAWNMLGYSQSMGGDVDAAVASFDKYIALAPTEANPHDSKGEVLMAAGRFEASEAAFLEATKVNPSFFIGWYGVAQTRFLRGDWAGGMEAVDTAREVAPRPEDKITAHAIRAWAHAAQGDRAAAEAACAAEGEEAKAQGLNTPFAFSAVTHGQVLLSLDAWADAAAAFDDAVARMGEVGLQGGTAEALQAQATLGKAHAAARAGQVEEAQEGLAASQQRLAAQPGLKNAVHHLEGVVALARGNSDAAITAMSRCATVAFTCRADLAEAQAAAGDEEAAAETLAEIRSRPVRQGAFLPAWMAAKTDG